MYGVLTAPLYELAGMLARLVLGVLGLGFLLGLLARCLRR